MTTTLSDLPKRIKAFLKRVKPSTIAEIRDYDWRTTIREHLRVSRIPERFWYEIKNWDKRQRQVFDECKSLLQNNGAIIALVGPRGVGKTSICSQLIIERAWNESLPPWHRRPPYRKLTDLISKLKPIYADFGSIDSERVTEYRNQFCLIHPLVIIDEIHECDEQRLKDRVLTDILDRRYSNLVDTILISNQTVEAFMETTNPSTLSRISEHGRIIRCEWPSFRSKA